VIKPDNIQSVDFTPNSDDTNLELENVKIEVKKTGERQRQISATIEIPFCLEKVWKVLTDYDALADFIPNLAKSRRLPHPQGGIRLEQIGSQRLLNFNFCARVVIDLEEYFPSLISFQMVEGDFKAFSGSWQLEPYSLNESIGTNLRYTVSVLPRVIMPIAIIERRLSHDMRLNLVAIYNRVEQINECN
jgi:ribosome-associated toxin RatA of RatAB toxin-antitoxin module